MTKKKGPKKVSGTAHESNTALPPTKGSEKHEQRKKGAPHSPATSPPDTSVKKAGTTASIKAVFHLLYRFRWLIIIVAVVVGLRSHYSSVIRQSLIPPGLVVDDPDRPGLAYNQSTIKMRRPVIMIPGFINPALELWEFMPCVTSGVLGVPAFRERLIGPLLITLVLHHPQCFLDHLTLSKKRYGSDPVFGQEYEDDAEVALRGVEGRLGKVRVRPAGWIDSSDYVMSTYWVWAKIIRSLADVGYEPNNMVMEPFDWRLSPAQLQERDGYFSRVKFSVEQAVRLSNARHGNNKKSTDTNKNERGEQEEEYPIKAVIMSHSYGGIIKVNFMNWAEQQEPGWADRYVHGLTLIGGPIMGIPKAVSALISGEMRDTATLPAATQNMFQTYLPRPARTSVTRSWGSLEGMMLRGCDALWPDPVTLFNQSIQLRGSDTVDMITKLSRHSGHTGFSDRMTNNYDYFKLSHLPPAKKMTVYTFYGINLSTEVGHAYTLAKSEETSSVPSDSEFTAPGRRNNTVIDPTTSLIYVDAAFRDAERALERVRTLHGQMEKREATSRLVRISRGSKYVQATLGECQEGGFVSASIWRRVLDVFYTHPIKHHSEESSGKTWNELCEQAQSAKKLLARAERQLQAIHDSTPNDQKDREVTLNNEIAVSEESWNEYLSNVVDNAMKVRSDAVAHLLSVFNGQPDGINELVDSVVKQYKGTPSEHLNFPAFDRDSFAKLSRQERKRLLNPVSLFQEQYLGNVTTGTNVAIDTQLNGEAHFQFKHRRQWYQCKRCGVTESNVSSVEDSERPIIAVMSPPVPGEPGAESHLLLQPGLADFGPQYYKSGVLLGSGDATAPLITNGYMSRASNGWRRDVGRIVTKEFLHRVSRSGHCRLLRDGDAKRSQRQRQDHVMNAADLETTTAKEEDDERLCGHTRQAGVMDNLDPRGGFSSADHVDIMGNYELIEDLLHVVTGNEEKVEGRVMSKIDDIVRDRECLQDD